MTALHVETPGDTQVIVRRFFGAPPALVYRAHVEPGLIRRWMNVMPGWTMPVVEVDARPGGSFRFGWVNDDGGTLRIEGEYLEIEAPGRILHAERMFYPDRTPDNRVETLFKARDGGTEMTMTMTLPDAAVRRAMLETGMTDGMAMTYDRLDEILARGTPMIAPLTIAPEGDTLLRIVRDFAAPRPLVWRAFTEADLVRRWLYSDDYPMTICEQDFRVGGTLRWGWQLAPDKTMVVNGRFVEIAAPHRLVHTELFEADWTGGETLVTTRLSEIEGGTWMDMTVRYSSAEARDGAARTPMAEGMEQGYARLDGLLAAGHIS